MEENKRKKCIKRAGSRLGPGWRRTNSESVHWPHGLLAQLDAAHVKSGADGGISPTSLAEQRVDQLIYLVESEQSSSSQLIP